MPSTYLWLVAVTGARRGELCGLWWADLDLQVGSVHVAHNYLVRGGQRIRKDTKTHQDRHLAIDRVTCDVLAAHRQRAVEALAAVGLGLADRAYPEKSGHVGLPFTRSTASCIAQLAAQITRVMPPPRNCRASRPL